MSCLIAKNCLLFPSYKLIREVTESCYPQNHKVLIHCESVIRYFSVLPLGQLSENAQESRNKDYKQFRLHHARQCSRVATNEDVLHALLYTSDPYIQV